jgi:AraC-like DNA-binding protein
MLNLINVLSTGSAIFLAFLVFTVRRDVNVVANRWLGLFLLLLSTALFDGNLMMEEIYAIYPWMMGLFNLSFLSLAPTLYLAVARYVLPDRLFRWRELWHFVPGLLLGILSLPFGLTEAELTQQEATIQAGKVALIDLVFLSLIVLQVLLYLFFAFRRLFQHRRNLEKITAAPAEVQLDWLLYFLYGVSFMVLAWIGELLFLPFNDTESWYAPVYFFAVYGLGYFALRQKEVFPFSPQDTAAVQAIMTSSSDALSARRSRITEDKFEGLKARLLELMEQEQPYLDPELNLAGLAQRMNLSLHELSELINVGFGENFAQFVNRYRVEESKRLLQSNKHAHLSMVGLAFEAGFNSKTAFNTAFKKKLGISPSQYQEELKRNT